MTTYCSAGRIREWLRALREVANTNSSIARNSQLFLLFMLLLFSNSSVTQNNNVISCWISNEAGRQLVDFLFIFASTAEARIKLHSSSELLNWYRSQSIHNRIICSFLDKVEDVRKQDYNPTEQVNLLDF